MSQLPTGWEEVQIGEVTQIVNGGTPSTKDPTNFSDEGGIPWITPSDLSGYEEIYIGQGARNLSEKGFASCSASLLPKNSVLFSSRAPIGYVAITSNELATNQGFKGFILPEGLYSKYIYYYLRHITPIAESVSTGTTFKELSATKAKRLPLLVPPHNEQKRIADKLDILLTKISACQERLEHVQLLLERFRQSVLATAISGELTKDWRDNKGISLDSWLIKSGDDVFPYITSGSRGWAKYYSDSGSIFLRVGNLVHDSIKVDLNDVQHVNLPPEVEGKRTRIEIGDILISITADVGRVALIDEDIGEAYINQHLCLARQSGEFSGSYLGYYLASPLGGRGQLTDMQRGVTKAGVTLGNIKELVFRIPKRAEQDEIVRRIEVLFSFADNIEDHCKTALKQVEYFTPTILDKAFRGKLVPQDSTDEPASKLLERIQLEHAKQADEPKKSRPHRRKRVKMTKETVKEAIDQFSDDSFSFEELRNSIPSDYEKLKEIIFSLLGETEPPIKQVFEPNRKAICLIRSGK
jgi:type I restriction enzyme, S subunit